MLPPSEFNSPLRNIGATQTYRAFISKAAFRKNSLREDSFKLDGMFCFLVVIVASKGNYLDIILKSI